MDCKRFLQTGAFALALMITSTSASAQSSSSEKASRLSLGGYGEAVMTRNFYSDNIYRYTRADDHKNDPSHGRFDLPHVTLNIGYDFGHGWTMGSEIEFEHGGTESAVEMDADEAGEYEAETEKGGEVALEQFWINKRFGQGEFNIKMGEIVVPVGATNKYHMPTEFFTCYRPEGENTLFPCTWHQVGISLWGRVSDWRYEVQFLSGLDSERFGSQSFVHYGATSPYEFKISNNYAASLRIDNYSVKGLRLSVSGYYGSTFKNTLRSIGTTYNKVKGNLAIASFDFMLDRWNWVVRGNADYAYLSDHAAITTFNKNFPTHSGQDGSPSKHQPVAKNAFAVGLEAGYDVFSQFERLKNKQKLYLFGRFEKYNSYAAGRQKSAYGWCDNTRLAFGVNYYPVKEVVVKGEWSERFLKSNYNNEPSVSIGVAYCGWFL
ncbi:MAG: hypothetical protein K6E52_08565 [Bacteroidaceae bacterium]|nr:hypothetical protein [Bacteroidaceae bacterium]